MEKVSVEIMVAKESKDIIDVLAELVKDIKEGKKLEALTENVAGIMAAVDGYDKLGEEIKSDAKQDTVAYMVAELWKAFEHKKAE